MPNRLFAVVICLDPQAPRFGRMKVDVQTHCCAVAATIYDQIQRTAILFDASVGLPRNE